MALAILTLLGAIWGGLIRIGWQWPALQPVLVVAHGPLMVSGFLGILIGLERAVALSAWYHSAANPANTGRTRHWVYAGPLVSAAGTLLLLVGLPGLAGPLLMTLGSVILVAVFVVIVRRQPALYTLTMGLGALAWLIGNGFWLSGWPVHRVVLWWVAFLALTIAGERLELARILRPSRASLFAFLAATGLFVIGLLATTVTYDLGVRLAGLGMVGLALWLLHHDVARHTVRKQGLPRFIAVCLLLGYVWLVAGGLMAVLFGGIPAGPRYDAMLHAIFAGFVISLIFGHAPIVFPSVLGVPLAYHSSFYLPLVLLHLSLALRVGGDLTLWWAGRQWGGLLNALAILLFLANVVRTIRSDRV
ncbi:MAG: hypothetical protein Kow0063_04210 [Anaerolineae bacterium]